MTHRDIVVATLTYDSTIQWMMDNNYIRNTRHCTSCTDRRMILERRGNISRWRCNRCKSSVSIFKDTILFNKNLDLPRVIDLIYFWCLNLTQNITMNEIGSHSRDTISSWYRTLSLQAFYIMRRIVPRKIGGVGHIVEVDEAKFSKRKFNVGRVVRSPWVIGGIDINTGDAFFREVLFRNQETITSVLQECVEVGTIIVTDCWRGYINISDLGYIHYTVNHSRNFLDPITGANTQAIENRWSVYKRKFRARFITSRSDLSLMFAEFMFKLMFKDDTFNMIMSNLDKF